MAENGITGDWEEWRRLILYEQKQHNQRLRAIEEKINLIHVDVAVLKTKAAFWGAVAGLVMTALIETVIKLAH